MYILPLVSIPVMIQFPVALNLYWLTNNLISLVQARIFKLPAVRKKFGIGEIIAWKPEDLPMTSYYVSENKSCHILSMIDYQSSFRCNVYFYICTYCSLGGVKTRDENPKVQAGEGNSNKRKRKERI